VPELAEVEAYRRLAEGILGRNVAEVRAPDPWYLKKGLDAEIVTALLVGRRFRRARRIGKLLLLDLDSRRRGSTADQGASFVPAAVLGLRFGMTGRLLVDGVPGVPSLLYSSNRVEERWMRFGLRFAGNGRLQMLDPRRLGGVELDPLEERLGPDAATIGVSQLEAALRGGSVALKARLLDQARVAGIGNLTADEVLWRAGLDPRRAAGSIDPTELRRLHRHLRATLADFLEEGGGSHTGRLIPARQRGGRCPRDGEALSHAVIGGRSTWWCPRHQQ
jgi:formamidopyrimidine-DNA glycosylase